MALKFDDIKFFIDIVLLKQYNKCNRLKVEFYDFKEINYG